MSSLALGAAFASVQLVYQAYSKVKTNKARCARLVERCQLVVDRLQHLVSANGERSIVERISELERAFEYAAYTIVQVGQQGLIASLVQSEANAIRIESCNEALTELVALFHLEEVVDVQRWQRESEAARLRDHQELLRLGTRIESKSDALARELAQQGTSLKEVHRLVQHISTGLRDVGGAGPPPLLLQLPPASPQSAASPSASSSSSGEAASSTYCTSATESALDDTTACSSPARDDCRPAPARRPSWANRVKLTAVFTKLSSPARGARYPESPLSASARAACDSPATPSRLVPPPKPGLQPLGASPGASPLDLPPPYRLHVVNVASDDGRSDAGSVGVETPSRLRFALCASDSNEAVRAYDSPTPCMPSPRFSTESVFGSTDSCCASEQGELRTFSMGEGIAALGCGSPLAL
ncbi:hypothetical protein FA95DRAFT_457139 [Auriscalpium vulgare]|uniref:Uncharacterized protein n=1 Tax=Auriscalpium vulgare TaxID=40419 RepID=A0ACB8SCE5_9AGAM|nr:hypothetical protein FA95DRAFT_457139 [Auriscalpium vulgare]